MAFNWYEVIGLIGTAFVLIGFSLSGESNIRKINMLGAAISVIYGLLISALSVVVLNASLVIIHVYKLYKLRETRRNQTSINTIQGYTYDNRRFRK